MKIIVMLVMAGAAFLFLGAYFLIDYIITGQRLKIHICAVFIPSLLIYFDRKLDAYVPWCEEQKIKNGWTDYYFPRI